MKEKSKQIETLIEPVNRCEAWSTSGSGGLISRRTNRDMPISLRSRLDTGLLTTLITVLLPGILWAAGQMPGEGQVSFFYTITHLHPVAYLILFFIFLLSLANLIYQGWIFGPGRPFFRLAMQRPDPHAGAVPDGKSRPQERVDAGRPRGRKESGVGYRPAAPDPTTEGVASKRRVVRKPDRMGDDKPTPLDGVNHPLPSFSSVTARVGMEAGQAKKQLEKSAGGQEFKFTCAVEVPSPEEMDRRDREKLVVSGTVRGVDGKGISSVLVYLTDEAGNRLGQSCRTLPETGEFKVQINQTGRYILHAHKRGLVMESPALAALPIESGKIEGYTVRMVPEGCLVGGKVITDSDRDKPGDLEVRCVDERGSIVGSSRVNSSGQFRIDSVPCDCRCVLEAWGSDGTLVGRSETLNTGRGRELYAEIKICYSRDGHETEIDAPDPSPANHSEDSRSAGGFSPT